ncbi:hypothetical protein K8R47_02585 [archaeon]|nr:hypothetical protein [archaeon]
MTTIRLINGEYYTLGEGEKLIPELNCSVDGTILIDRGLILGSHSASCVSCGTLYFGSKEYPSQTKLDKYGHNRANELRARFIAGDILGKDIHRIEAVLIKALERGLIQKIA